MWLEQRVNLLGPHRNQEVDDEDMTRHDLNMLRREKKRVDKMKTGEGKRW